MVDRSVPQQQCDNPNKHAAHINETGIYWCNGLAAPLDIPDVPQAVNGVGEYVIVTVGDQWVDVWDQHTKDEWNRESYIRLSIPDTSEFAVGMKCHIRIIQPPKGL